MARTKKAVQEDLVGELGVPANGEAAPKAKKKREAYYMVVALAPDGRPHEILNIFRSRKMGNRWIDANRLLIQRIAPAVTLVRCRNVEVRAE